MFRKNILPLLLIITIVFFVTILSFQILGITLNSEGEIVSAKWNLISGQGFATNWIDSLEECKSKGEETYNSNYYGTKIEFVCATKCIEGSNERSCEEAVGAICLNGKCEYFYNLEKAKGGFVFPPN